MLSEEQMKKLAGFDADIFAAVRNSFRLGSEALSAAGALSVTKYLTELTVSGTLAFTLAAPTVEGQRKLIRCVGASNTPLGTLTITSPDDTTGFVCASSFLFDAVGQEVELVATASLKWRAVRIVRAGVRSAVVGTTVLTGMNLSLVYSLSVTGTVSSTTTKGIPNGSCVGETINIVCDTAALSPIGDISGTFINMLGAAATSIGAIGVAASASVTGDMVTLRWNGSAWVAIYINGVTFA